MKKLAALLGDIEIDRDLKLLLTIGGLYSLGIFLSNTFVNIYLWKQSGEYVSLAAYNIAVYIMQPLTFILAGRWAKKVDRVIVLRLGVIFLSLFFMTVLLAGEKAATYNVLLGALLGIGYGFYWLAYNVLTFEVTEPETRDFFNGFLGLLQSFGGMIGPILAGYIISRMDSFQGYTIIFSISFSLFVLAVICTMFLKRRSAEGVFSYRRIITERKHNANWKRILYAHTFQGLREGIFVFVISVWVFVTTQSEFALGTFNLIFSGFSFLFYLLATKFIKPHMRKGSIFVGGLSLYLSIYLILIHMSYPTLLIYAALIGISYPILYVPYFSMSFDVIGKAWKAGEMRIEYIVVRELFLNVGRVFSIGIFLIAISIFSAETIIPYLLMIFGAGHFIIYFFVKDINLEPKKEHSKQKQKQNVFVKNELVDEENR
ncbi:MFS transporter [Aquibacillus sp. 3ASR75-11]|uniref:MFS transporter n=1 Tax=Terrihalobacillus insolitus TaxID=2950438 RepID=A0A9X4ANX1_9BACI|nr:MFS transporter [Terrihalobacillus insolitus]MDC3413377.1 MFS transporter [Terrihalobacillus insolitus]MDC3424960.1 MFS transporter [Terrihalobacillus insolitus]